MKNLNDRNIPSLDGMRALSIILVLGSHSVHSAGFPSWLVPFFSRFVHGDLGVTIFFVISGLLITLILLKEKNINKIDIKKFYARRFLRIFPVYYLYIFALFMLSINSMAELKGYHYLFALTYTVNFCSNAVWLIGHAWSLAVEEQFYLFWPWVANRSKRTMIIVAFVIIVCGPIARMLSSQSLLLQNVLLVPFFRHADAIMIGALLGVIIYYNPKVLNFRLFKSNAILFLSIMIIVLVSYSLRTRYAFYTASLGNTVISLCIATVLVRVTTVRKGIVFRCLNHPVLAYIGVLSYSLYIWQQPFLYSSDAPMGNVWWRVFPMNIALTFAVAMCSYHLWEKMFLRIKERYKVATLKDIRKVPGTKKGTG